MLGIKYKKLAFFDVLCNCHNRNYFEIKLVKKYFKKDCFITIIDIDDFKGVNDLNGHLAGDKILQELVELFKTDKNVLDICRYGGDEFIIFHIEKIDFHQKQIDFFKKSRASFSFGTEFKTKYQPVKEILGLSDKKLYKNKKKGQ